MNILHLYRKVNLPRAARPARHVWFARFLRRTSARRTPYLPALETAIGIAAIVIAATRFPGHWGLLDLQPHPLWIVVLAIAVRYGGGYGYLAGGAAAAVYAALLWMRPGAHLQPLPEHQLLQPFLMLLAGAAIGELVRGRERRVADLDARLRESEGALTVLWGRYMQMEKNQDELEKQIAFQHNSVATLARLGARMHSLQLDELHRAILDTIATLLEVESCALLVRDEDGWTAAAGLPEDDGAHTAALHDPLVRLAVEEGRVVTLRDRLERDGAKSANGAAVLMAGPLALAGGRLHGVVVLESLPATAMNPWTANRLADLLRWASAAVENALRIERSRAAYLRPTRAEPWAGASEVAWMLTPGVGHAHE